MEGGEATIEGRQAPPVVPGELGEVGVGNLAVTGDAGKENLLESNIVGPEDVPAMADEVN